MQRTLILITLSTGCLAGRRHIELPPAPAAARANTCVEIHRFADARQDRTQVGNVRNGFGGVTGEIHTYDDVVSWVEAHVASRLANASCGRARYVVDGEVHEVFVDDVFRAHARVAATITVRRDGEVVLRQTFQGRSAALHWGTAGEYRELLREAVADMSRTAAQRIAVAI